MNEVDTTDESGFAAYVMNPIVAEESAYLMVFILIVALFFFIFRMKKGGE